MAKYASANQQHRTAPIVRRAFQFYERTAIIDAVRTYSFRDLLEASARIASGLHQGRRDLNEARVCFLLPSGFEYVAVQWGVWRAGGIAVPLSTSYPLPEIEYVISNSDAEAIVYHPEFSELLQPLIERERSRQFIASPKLFSSSQDILPEVDEKRRAMILYTSGTTSKPKGVVSTHLNIKSQILSLVEAWEWTENDYILHVLPLHHIHGIVNVLSCALWSGAKCEMLSKFDVIVVWNRFLERDLTLFMAVPTIYNRLIAHWEKDSEDAKAKMSRACHKFRLFVSGSAALPVTVLEKWKQISGHVLLERYGMTEIGMALSNPLHGERRPSYVGTPLPYVEVKLAREDGKEIPLDSGELGEIYVKGPSVFLEYWRRLEITKESFRDGWFKTGDVAVLENGYYRILGRKSVDIIKTGGYKVSALEIEEMLRTHPAIKECAVVGVEDEDWGERVCAAVILRSGVQLTLDELRDWASEKLAKYKIPKQLEAVNELPRNAMGKVMKPDVKNLFLL